jgi:hypothetical protein
VRAISEESPRQLTDTARSFAILHYIILYIVLYHVDIACRRAIAFFVLQRNIIRIMMLKQTACWILTCLDIILIIISCGVKREQRVVCLVDLVN